MDQNDPAWHEAEVGDRITVEYETPESASRETVNGEVVYLDVNANDLIMNTWFVGDDGYLYQLGKNRISRTSDRYTAEAAAEQLSGFDPSEIINSLERLDGLTEAGQNYSNVDVLNIEPPEESDEADDYESMTDYALQAAALQEAREGTLSDAFDTLLERQEQVHTDFIRAQAYENNQQLADELRIRSDRLRTGLKDAMDKAND